MTQAISPKATQGKSRKPFSFGLWFAAWVFLGGSVYAAEINKASPESPVPSPQRIVSINLCTDELLFRLVPEERIAAVSVHCADPAISSVSQEAGRVPKIKGGIEEVLAAKPDLLLGGTFSNQQTLHFFQYSDTPVVVLGVPKSFEDIYGSIRKLARAVGETEKGEALIGEMQGELEKLKQTSSGGVVILRPEDEESKDEIPRPERAQDDGKKVPLRAVFFQSGNYVPGSGTFENAIMEAAGLKNVAAELGIKDYGNLPLERLIEAKPDILIFATDQTKNKTVRGEVLEHPALKKGLPHVKIVKLPASFLNCGSPASVEAVRILVKEIYSPSLSKRG
jgi:iron complex transport system substrate-binding protein